jgi:hypothetical protein
LLDRARPLHSAVSLSVSRDNPALRLCRRFGFQVVGAEGGSITMVKHLAHSLDEQDDAQGRLMDG